MAIGVKSNANGAGVASGVATTYTFPTPLSKGDMVLVFMMSTTAAGITTNATVNINSTQYNLSLIANGTMGSASPDWMYLGYYSSTAGGETSATFSIAGGAYYYAVVVLSGVNALYNHSTSAAGGNASFPISSMSGAPAGSMYMDFVDRYGSGLPSNYTQLISSALTEVDYINNVTSGGGWSVTTSPVNSQYGGAYSVLLSPLPSPTTPTWSTQPVANSNHVVGSTITLGWSVPTPATAGDTISYTLQQSLNGGAWTNVATGLTGVSYIYTIPSNVGSNVKFQVIANESNGGTATSAVSNTTNIVNNPNAPAIGTEPTSLIAPINLSWNAVTPQGTGDTITYTLQYQDVTANGAWTNIATGITGTSYSWTPSPALTAGHNYSVQVFAVESDGGQSTPTLLLNNLPTFVPMSALTLPQPNNPSAKANIDYIRTQVNTFRSNNGRNTWNWTDPTIIAGVTPVKAIHMTEIQQAIDDVYMGLNVPYANATTQTTVKQTVTAKDPANFPIREMSIRLQTIIKGLENL